MVECEEEKFVFERSGMGELSELFRKSNSQGPLAVSVSYNPF